MALGEVARHSLGKMLDKSKNRGQLQPYLRNLNVRWFEFDLSDLSEMRFLPEELDRFSIQKGDLVVCEGGYPGRAAIWREDRPIYFQKALHRIRCAESLSNRWALYHFYHLELSGEIRIYLSGTGIQHLTGESLHRIKIPLPPLPEQKRIVAILDEAFAAIATAKANAEKNLQNARALTDAKLDELFLPGAYGWPQLTVAEICSKITDGEHLRPKMTPSGIPFLSAKDVLDNGVDFSDPLYVAPSDAMKFRRRCDPEFGDVLVVSRGATVGRTCIVRSTRVFCLLGSVILLKVSDLVLPEFLAYTFKSKAIRTQLMTLSEASAQQAIYLRDIKTLRVNCPSPNDQARAVSHLNSIFLETNKLESVYRRKLAALDELKRSLLHRAFNGDL
jgi:restriction endonuclease S subunit